MENLKFYPPTVNGGEELLKDYEDLGAKADHDFEAERDEETLCGKPHDGGDNEPDNCAECMAIKLNI